MSSYPPLCVYFGLNSTRWARNKYDFHGCLCSTKYFPLALEVKIYPPDTTVTATPMEFEITTNWNSNCGDLGYYITFLKQYSSAWGNHKKIPIKNDHHFGLYLRITNPRIKTTWVKNERRCKSVRVLYQAAPSYPHHVSMNELEEYRSSDIRPINRVLNVSCIFYVVHYPPSLITRG